jgi:hypothetical protein
VSLRTSYGTSTVEWDKDFHFINKADDSAFKVDEKLIAPTCAVGAAFLSGKKNIHTIYVNKDGSDYNFMVSGSTVVQSNKAIEDLDSNDSVAICGEGVKDRRILRYYCKATKAHTVTVNPLGEYLTPFGQAVGILMLKKLVRPRMTRFCEPNSVSLDLEGKDFDPDLEGDGIGRMAHLVQSRTPVVNQMMTTPSTSAFYNRVLMSGRWWGDPIFLMLPEIALKYFPTEPLSIRNYSAMWVPTPVDNNEEFAKASGFGGSLVNIFVASELTPMLGSFLRFIQIMSKDEFVTSSDPKDLPIPDKIPLFRYHSAYNINDDIFKEIVLESR